MLESTALGPKLNKLVINKVNCHSNSIGEPEKTLVTNSNIMVARPNKISSYLKKEVIYKIINKFLIEKNIPKKNLAAALAISPKTLERFLSQQKVSFSLIAKVNLPLIKLFCKTKFN